jgi:hypothetical protein
MGFMRSVSWCGFLSYKAVGERSEKDFSAGDEKREKYGIIVVQIKGSWYFPATPRKRFSRIDLENQGNPSLRL